MIRVMLRRIYLLCAHAACDKDWDAHSQGSVKHQLPIVAVIASGQLLQGVYLRSVVVRGEIPWSGVITLWCWKGGRFANNHYVLCVMCSDSCIMIADISGILGLT